MDAGAQLRFASQPFQLGVASGDPSADGFVIWTRLAPEPFDTGYLGQTIFEVAWEVVEDASFTRIAKHGTANSVVLTGDIHSFWVNNLANAAGRPVGVELVTSSIATSTYDKSAVLPLNPGAKFHDGTHNGYVRCELTRDALRADVVTIADRADPRSSVSVAASFEIRSGDPHARRVSQD